MDLDGPHLDDYKSMNLFYFLQSVAQRKEKTRWHQCKVATYNLILIMKLSQEAQTSKQQIDHPGKRDSHLSISLRSLFGHTWTRSPKAEQGRSSIPIPADTCDPTQSVPPEAASASASKKFGCGCSRHKSAGGRGRRNPMRSPFIIDEYIPSVVAGCQPGSAGCTRGKERGVNELTSCCICGQTTLNPLLLQCTGMLITSIVSESTESRESFKLTDIPNVKTFWHFLSS